MKMLFDKIIIDNDEKEYAFAQGYENFIHKLSASFPGEEKALSVNIAKRYRMFAVSFLCII